MEHLASDVLNIKESLIRMKKFIAGKSINSNKANNIKDLKSMGKAIWEFITTVYESYWDVLHINNNNTIFRSKVKSKNLLLKSRIIKLYQSKITTWSNRLLFQPFLYLSQLN